MSVFGFSIPASAWVASVTGVAVLGIGATLILLRDLLRLERDLRKLQAENERLMGELQRVTGHRDARASRAPARKAVPRSTPDAASGPTRLAGA